MLTFNLRVIDTDEKFTYKLHKNPFAEKDFERQAGLRKITGFYINDSSYFGTVSFGTLDEVVDLEMHQTWNFSELSLHTLYSLTSIFNTTLRSAVRGQLNSDLSFEDVDTSHNYTMLFTPVGFYNSSKLETICKILGIEVLLYEEQLSILFKANLPLHLFLQGVYIALFAHLKSKDDRLVKEQMQLVGGYINNANVSDEEKETISKLITGRVHSLKAAMAESLDVEYDSDSSMSLHDWKHSEIVKVIDKYYNAHKVTEFGCGSGQFALKLHKDGESNYKYVGYDIDNKNIERSRRRVKNKNYTFKQADILLLDEVVELLLLLEVIEHLTEEERDYLVRLINNVYNPNVVIITTPNIEANTQLYGMEVGQLRHPDHKIEFNELEFFELCSKFTNYSAFHNIVDTRLFTGTLIKPSFVTMLVRKDTATVDEKFVAEHKNKLKEVVASDAMKVSPFRLYDVDYSITTKQLQSGMQERSYIKNAGSIFYLGCSIAPADYKETGGLVEGQIEHPLHVFDYYENRNYKGEYAAQIKHMGSRGYVWVCRNETIANRYNMPLVSVRSRNGYEFFSEQDIETYNTQIHNDVYGSGKNTVEDFVILDAEITPWSYKADGLIQREFYEPVFAQLNGINSYNSAILNAGRYGYINCNNHTAFLYTLQQFTRKSDVKIHVFNVLATGHNVGTRNEGIFYGQYMPRQKQDIIIESLCSGSTLLQKVETVYGEEDIMNLWKNVNDNRAIEGIVIKPVLPIADNGLIIQSATKVRTMSYLQLVYGPNYLDYLPRILQRNISKKRRRSILEQSIGNHILQAFCERDNFNREKYISAFFSMNGMKTDGTL